MEARASIPVALPHANPSISYWQDPPASIADHRSSPALSETADYVILGSGISGTCIAYNLLSRRPSAKVVLLEARQACSGATGRNGGHTKAASYRSFATNAANLGEDEAVRIAKLEHANIKATHALAAENNIECDSTPCKTVDIIYDQGQWDAGIAAIEYMNQVLGVSTDRGTDVYRIVDAAETESRYLCPGAIGAFEYEAGSTHAYNFTIGILKFALARGLQLYTSTPVTSVEQSDSGSDVTSWTLTTPNGTIKTPHVIFATNGYTAHILPQFQKVIVPLRGQVSAQRPGSSLPYSGALPTTYSFIYDNGYEYMIPRPAGSKFAGDIVIGGGWSRALPDEGQSEFGTCDDSGTDERVAKYLADCTVNYFGAENWGEDAPEGRVRKEWTGIMGTSADGLPYVGAVPGREGQWVSASFDGHGMVLCLKCAEAVTSMVLDEQEKDGIDDWFPRSFRVTQKRLEMAFEGRRNMRAPPEPLETRSHI